MYKAVCNTPESMGFGKCCLQSFLVCLRIIWGFLLYSKRPPGQKKSKKLFVCFLLVHSLSSLLQLVLDADALISNVRGAGKWRWRRGSSLGGTHFLLGKKENPWRGCSNRRRRVGLTSLPLPSEWVKTGSDIWVGYVFQSVHDGASLVRPDL